MTCVPDFLSALDIADVDTFDPNSRWRENEVTASLRIPLGTGWDAENHAPSTAVKTIDFSESMVGGDGQHGTIHGADEVSVGKLISALALGLCATYSAEKVNLLFVESRSASSVPHHVRRLPQVLPSVTGFKDSPLALGVLNAALREELDYRKDVLTAFKARDLTQYHAVKDTLTDAPALPHIVMFVRFEDGELSKAARRRLSRVLGLGAYGRSLGLHVVVVSEPRRSVLWDFAEHISWNVSLKPGFRPTSQTPNKESSRPGLDLSVGEMLAHGDVLSHFGMLDCGTEDEAAKALALRISQFRRETETSPLERILSRVDFCVEDE